MKRSILLLIGILIFTLCIGQKEKAQRDVSEMVIDHLGSALGKSSVQDHNHMKCLTPILLAGRNNYDKLNEKAKNLIDAKRERPVFEGTEQIVTLGNFAYHYSIDGPPEESVDSSDANESGFPDYVELIAFTFAPIAQFYHELNALALPPDDNEEINGAYYDIYISGKAAGEGTYGFVQPEDRIDDNPKTTRVEFDATTSYMVLRNNYDGFPTQGSNAIRVTLAHEYLHAIQFGYFSINDIWLFEGTAAYAEDWVFPGIDDNLQYLESLFSNSDIALNLEPGELPEFDGFWYSSWLFYKYITEHTSTDILKDIFEGGVEFLSVGALGLALEKYESNFTDAYRDYLVSLILLSEDANLDPYHLNRAQDYVDEAGSLRVESNSDFIGEEIIFNSAVDGDGVLMRMGIDAHLLTSTQDFMIDASYENEDGEVIFGIVKIKVDNGAISNAELQMADTAGTTANIHITNADDYDFFVLAAVRGADTNQPNSLDYEFRISSMTTTATQDLSDTNIITIHPNPSDRHVVINSLNLKEGLYYSLVDPLGREVIERRRIDIDKSVDISSLPAGLYYMSITDKSGTILKVEKLIKSEIK